MQVWEIRDLVDLVVCRLHCGNHYHHDRHLDNAIVFMIDCYHQYLTMATCRLVKEGRVDNKLPRDVSLCIFCEADKKKCLVVLISFIWIIDMSEDVFKILIIVKVNVIFCANCYILIVIVTCLMRSPGV